jgi:hypothetical protein
VKRGLILLDLDFVAGWSQELKAMNAGKEGSRYRYSESFIKLLAVVHAYVLLYRQLEGFMRGLRNRGYALPDRQLLDLPSNLYVCFGQGLG